MGSAAAILANIKNVQAPNSPCQFLEKSTQTHAELEEFLRTPQPWHYTQRRRWESGHELISEISDYPLHISPTESTELESLQGGDGR